MGVAKVPQSQWANSGNQDFTRREGVLCPRHLLSTLEALKNISNLRVRPLERRIQGNSDRVMASWLAARHGREVIEIVNLPVHGKETWEIVLVEDDKGLVTVRADNRDLALKRAMAAIGYGNVPR